MVQHAPRLLCIGDLGLDHVIAVPSLPGRDEKVSGATVARGPGGMAANVAVAARRLGTGTVLAARIGDDPAGQEALAGVQAEGVDTRHVAILPGAPTFTCIVLLDASGEKALVRAESAAFLPDPAQLDAAVTPDIRHLHLVHPDGTLLGRARALASKTGGTLSLDLEPTDLPDSDVALADTVAAPDLLFCSSTCRHAIEARLGALTATSDRILVTTRGARGAVVETAAERYAVNGHPVQPRDTLGAGDAFVGGFLHGLLGGASLPRALAIANATGALATQAFGAQPALPRAPELDALLRQTEVQGA